MNEPKTIIIETNSAVASESLVEIEKLIHKNKSERGRLDNAIMVLESLRDSISKGLER